MSVSGPESLMLRSSYVRSSELVPSTKWYQVGNESTLRCDGCVPLALPVQSVTPLPPNPTLAEPVALGKSVRFQTVHTGMHLPFAARNRLR